MNRLFGLTLLVACTGDTPDSDTDPDTQPEQPSRDMAFTDAVSVSIIGDEPEAEAGNGVALCDLDADGHLDLLVGASHGMGRYGQIGVFYGPTDDWSSYLVMSDADTHFVGEEHYSYVGTSVECADIDGDGNMDVVSSRAEINEVVADKDYHLLIWYGDGERPPAEVTDAQADAQLHLDLQLEPETSTIAEVDLAIADFDGDGADDIALSTRNDASQIAYPSEVWLIAGDRYGVDDLINVRHTVLTLPDDEVIGVSATDSTRGADVSDLHILRQDTSFDAHTLLREPMDHPETLALADANTTRIQTEDIAIAPWFAGLYGRLTPSEDPTLLLFGVTVTDVTPVMYRYGGAEGPLADETVVPDNAHLIFEDPESGDVPIQMYYLCGDYDGDGTSDILRLQNFPERIDILSGTSFQQPQWTEEDALLDTFRVTRGFPNGSDIRFGDLDNDGLVDLVFGRRDGLVDGNAVGRVDILLSSQQVYP